ncbi:hypothetical protein FX983_06551 [Pseudomonas frederiksbergensis]|uniref:Uncharacterized protein n=1 Tax=Pseudomonas frederiksbergensis TaxID=104087 RepID=A0A6L5BJZ2_9PSED|nr:hypothetical protein FX983_06551 [Pseudomonas frederiksbergensis]
MRAQVGRRQLHVLTGNHVGHQTLVARFVFTGDDHGFTQMLTSREFGFDFTQFDAETTDLHLIVVTAQVLNRAVRQPATEVTRAIQPRIGTATEDIGDKAFVIELRTVQVTASHTGTADVHFADHTHRHRLAPGVEHIQLQIGNAPANRADTDQ